MLIKSNRTALEKYKVEERTFGTPCIYFIILYVFTSFAKRPEILIEKKPALLRGPKKNISMSNNIENG